MNQSRQMMELLDMAEGLVTANAVNMDAKYRKFVRLLFDSNRLAMPALGRGVGNVIFKVGRSKFASGTTKLKFNRQTKQIVSPITVTMSDKLQMEEDEFDAVFVHELIHVHFNHIGDIRQAHRSGFLKMRRLLSKKMKVGIPLEHDVSKLEINPAVAAKSKSVGIVVKVKEGGRISVALITNKLMTTKQRVVRYSIANRKKSNKGRYYLFRAAHPLQHEHTIQRSILNSLGHSTLDFFFETQEKVQDLLDMVSSGAPEFIVEITDSDGELNAKETDPEMIKLMRQVADDRDLFNKMKGRLEISPRVEITGMLR